MKKIVFSIALAAFTSASVFAQDILGDFSVSSTIVGTSAATATMTEAEQQAILDTVPHDLVFTFMVLDPSAVNIRLQVGSARDNWNKFNGVINLNGTDLPAGVLFEKNGNSVKITFPKQLGVFHFYASGRITLANGDYSRTYWVTK
jgi:hypothetical protein